MKSKIEKIAKYLSDFGFTEFAKLFKKRRFADNAMLTQFINSQITLKVEQWDKIRKVLNEGNNYW